MRASDFHRKAQIGAIFKKHYILSAKWSIMVQRAACGPLGKRSRKKEGVREMKTVLPGAEKELLEKMYHGGVFLTVGGETPNTMTIGWGSIGVYWYMDVMTVCVRPQRHTYTLLETNPEFTVSVPIKNDCKEQLRFAGSVSGRDVDKFDGHGLTAVPGRSVNAPVVGECGLHFECRLKMKTDMANMDQGVLDRWYPERDLHTLYFAEIVDCYYTEEA